MSAAAPLDSTSTFAPRLHSLTLRFADRDTELRYRAWFYERNRRYYRIGLWVSIVVLGLVGPLEVWGFPAQAWQPALAIRYGLVLPALGAMLWGCTAERWQAWMRRWRDEAATVGVTAVFLGLLWIGSFTTPHTGLVPDGYAAVGFVIAILFMYMIVRLRFLYAVAVIVPMNAIVLPALMARDLDPLIAHAALFYTGLANLAGMIGCYRLDRSARGIFIDERRMEQAWQRVEAMLRQALPPSVVPRLHARGGRLAEARAGAAILFADVVGFTPLAARMQPEALVGLLDELFRRFDAEAAALGVEKVKTIGDAWMGVAGAPLAHADPAAAVAHLALRMRRCTAEVAEAMGVALDVRIGLNQGPVVGGVIGARTLAWDVWGDAVNVASRMESSGEKGRIQLPATMAVALGGRFRTAPRGVVEVKGKGPLATHWLQDAIEAPPPPRAAEVPALPEVAPSLWRMRGVHPLTLSFLDQAQERAYWLDHFDRNRRVLIAAGLCGCAFILPAEWIEHRFFPEIIDTARGIRLGLMLPTALLGLAMLLVPALTRRLRPVVQPVFAVLTLAVFAGLARISVEILDKSPVDATIYLSLGYLTAVCVLFILLPLRTLYAATIALSAVLIGGATYGLGDTVSPAAFFMGAHLSALAAVAGALGAYSLELNERRAFDLRQRISAEHARAEALLANTLPLRIARRWEQGERPIADAHADVAVLFADLVGFTDYAATTPAERLVADLDALFRAFDACCTRFGAEKIKTIGDAWMAAVGLEAGAAAGSGLSDRAVGLAFALQAALAEVSVERGLSLALRVGVHRGPVVAGVIGQQRVQYDVWGDTVNVASRMESHGEPGRVHVSEGIAGSLGAEFRVEWRGEIAVKGRGMLRTAWVNAVEGRVSEHP